MEQKSLEKLVEILEQQSQLFTENTLQKDCKSKIYNILQEHDKRLTKLEETLKGDCFSNGLINKIENIEKVVESISDYIKSQKAQLKVLNWIVSVIGFSNIIAVLLFLSKLH